MAIEKKCPTCASTLVFDPETGCLLCDHCGYSEQPESVADPDINDKVISGLNENSSYDWGLQTKIVTCRQCGGETIYDALVVAGKCPFCGSNTLIESDDDRTIAPNAVIPFQISEEQASSIFKEWIGRRFFAPKDVKDGSRLNGFTGVYVPNWSFDINIYAQYSGKFGHEYGSGDNAYMKWNKSSGAVKVFVKDYALLASKRLAGNRYYRIISKFDLSKCIPYTPDVLSGFIAEKYSINVDEAWGKAKAYSRKRVEKEIQYRENADAIDKLKLYTEYEKVSVNYFLAPIWISSYSYKGKNYSVLINGQTRSITGVWPQATWKYVLLIAFILGILLSPFIYTFIWAVIFRPNQF